LDQGGRPLLSAGAVLVSEEAVLVSGGEMLVSEEATLVSVGVMLISVAEVLRAAFAGLLISAARSRTRG
jgi:hypothetical protein